MGTDRVSELLNALQNINKVEEVEFDAKDINTTYQKLGRRVPLEDIGFSSESEAKRWTEDNAYEF